MDISVITDLIGSNYFPIAMCILLLYWIQKLIEQQKQSEKLHNEEMQKMTEALNNNTLAITVLSTRLEVAVHTEEPDTSD